RLLAVLLLFASIPVGLQAARRDPLNELEVEQLREAAQDPPKRLRLMLKFTRDRMALVDAHRNSPATAENYGRQMHDLIEDFSTLASELDVNVETYAQRGVDVRKPLREVLRSWNEFQEKLKSLKDQSEKDPALAKAFGDYKFILEDALDAVSGGLETTVEAISIQELAHKNRKK
ncbi:MAG: hypothetical protein ACRD24_05605, partial [Terriglobales bacterium]